MRSPATRKDTTFSIEILEPDEVRALLARCSETSSTGLRYRALITLLYRTGLRISEMLALGVHDGDLDDGAAVVLFARGGTQRTVDIDPDAFEHTKACTMPPQR